MKYLSLMIVALVGFAISSAQAEDHPKAKTPAPAQHLKKPEVPAEKMAEKEPISEKVEEMDNSAETPSESWDSDADSYESDE